MAVWHPLFDLPRNMSVVKHRCHGLTAIAQLAGAVGGAHSQIFYGCRKRACGSSADSRLVLAGAPRRVFLIGRSQILIGLLELYFVSRTGVDALAGVTPVFPLVSLLVAVAQGAIGGGIVTTVARALGTGRIDAASEYAWYAVALAIPLGLSTTAVMLRWVQVSTPTWASLEMRSRLPRHIRWSFFRVPC